MRWFSRSKVEQRWYKPGEDKDEADGAHITLPEDTWLRVVLEKLEHLPAPYAATPWAVLLYARRRYRNLDEDHHTLYLTRRGLVQIPDLATGPSNRELAQFETAADARAAVERLIDENGLQVKWAKA